jgi:hypothetical protein
VAPNKQPAPTGHARSGGAAVDDGTNARTPSPRPVPTGGTPAPAPTAATGDCAYLNPRTSGTVRAPQAVFDRLRGLSGAAAISTTRAKASQAWPFGPASEALEQDVTIDNQTILVIRPTDAAAAGKNFPTTAQLAEALRALPARQRTLNRRVILCPNPNPASRPGHTIAGEGGAGEIILYPVGIAQGQNDFDNRVMHESGHNYQGFLWNSVQAVGEWRNVVTQDNLLPSPYAGENAGEDFSEFIILYNAARGTPCESAAITMYINRWTKMVEYQSR